MTILHAKACPTQKVRTAAVCEGVTGVWLGQFVPFCFPPWWFCFWCSARHPTFTASSKCAAQSTRTAKRQHADSRMECKGLLACDETGNTQQCAQQRSDCNAISQRFLLAAACKHSGTDSCSQRHGDQSQWRGSLAGKLHGKDYFCRRTQQQPVRAQQCCSC